MLPPLLLWLGISPLIEPLRDYWPLSIRANAHRIPSGFIVSTLLLRSQGNLRLTRAALGLMLSPLLLWLGVSPLIEPLRGSLWVAQTHWDSEWGIHDDAWKASMIINHLRWFEAKKTPALGRCEGKTVDWCAFRRVFSVYKYRQTSLYHHQPVHRFSVNSSHFENYHRFWLLFNHFYAYPVILSLSNNHKLINVLSGRWVFLMKQASKTSISNEISG